MLVYVIDLVELGMVGNLWVYWFCVLFGVVVCGD